MTRIAISSLQEGVIVRDVTDAPRLRTDAEGKKQWLGGSAIEDLRKWFGTLRWKRAWLNDGKSKLKQPCSSHRSYYLEPEVHAEQDDPRVAADEIRRAGCLVQHRAADHFNARSKRVVDADFPLVDGFRSEQQ